MRCPKMDRIFFFIKFVTFRTLKLFVRKVKYLVYFIWIYEWDKSYIPMK